LELQNTYGKDKLIIIPLDVTSLDSHRIAKSILIDLDISKLDVLIANAAILTSTNINGSFMNCTEESMVDSFKTNVVGCMYTMQTFNDMLSNSSTKLCILVSSNLGSISNSFGIYLSYSTSKAALNMLGMTYAQESSRTSGCKVICLHPGWVQTDMGGAEAILSVDESTNGIINVVQSAVNIQQELLKKETNNLILENFRLHGNEFEKKFITENCVFAQYDGKILPW
jgi:NAD(P)-dependent dehydrogenase (short-subunit alcohol dehydrogenase family)